MAVIQDAGLGARFGALAYDAYQAAMRATSIEKAADAGSAIVRRLGPLTSAHHVAKTNLRLAFPDLSEPARDALLDEIWNNLGRTFGEFPQMHRFDVYTPGARVTAVHPERVTAMMADKRGAVLVGGHFANWEVIGFSLAQHTAPTRITYRPANNLFIDKRIQDQRAAYGIRLLAAKGREGGMALLRTLAKGEGVGIMNDQKYNEGVAVPFFGHDAMTADGPSRLARRFNCPIMTVSLKRLPRSRFRIEFHEPFMVDQTDDEEADITAAVAKITGIIEGWVRESPADWFWVHRRWPKSIYKGEP